VTNEVIKKKEVPWWLSIFYLFAGLIYILISVISLGMLNSDVQVLLDLLTVVLIFLGISRLLYGIFIKDLIRLIRISKILVGTALIILGSIDFFIRESDFVTQITLLVIGILLISVLRITVGLMDKSEADWFRIMLISIGSITFLISLLFLIFPRWNITIYIILLAVSFILHGFTKINYSIKIFDKKG
jgi:uncharacterized membrane protein HdeD (DUF308 family)